MVNAKRLGVAWLFWYLRNRDKLTLLVTMNHGGTHYIRMLIACYIELYFGVESAESGLKKFDIIRPLWKKEKIGQSDRHGSIPLVFNSHMDIRPFYVKNVAVLLLVRDMRDVLVSYYNTISTRSSPELSFGDFLREKNLPKRERHLRTLGWRVRTKNRWLYKKSKAADVELIKFEGLMRCPEDVLRRCVRFLGVPVDEGVIRQAVENSSLEAMSSLEEEDPYMSGRGWKKIRGAALGNTPGTSMRRTGNTSRITYNGICGRISAMTIRSGRCISR